MRLALAQLDALVGDLVGNGERILNACRRAAGAGARLVLTPELSLWGYPPRDLLLRPSLLEAQTRALESLAAEMPEGTGVLVGMADPIPGSERPALYNAVALVEAGGWQVVGRKRLLPSYDVFDERRYFRPAEEPSVLELGSDGRTWRLGLTICEDLWVEEELQGHRLAGADPIADLQAQRLDLLLNLSASPFGQGKAALRRRLAARAATRLGVPVVYVNQVGGNDELVFDGAGFVVDAAGAVVLQQAWSAEDLSLWELAASQGSADRSVPAESAASLAPQGSGASPLSLEQAASDRLAPPASSVFLAPQASMVAKAPQPFPAEQAAVSVTPQDPPATPPGSLPPPLPLAEPEASEQLLRALVLGVSDYARKCGFRGALLGLSGGIDSALVAVIACAALGAERVRALRMPSPWSSEGSLTDAADLAARLGLTLGTVPIAPLMEAMEGSLTPTLGAPPAGLTAENLQSRLRGTLLMAVANQEGQLLLSTGNKSELAVGYCTLYGDMNGGLAVIGDLYKTTVFRLCAWLDAPESAACRAALGLPAEGELIGAAIRGKPPSAELRPDQRDSDSLPDYGVLDPILKALVEELASPEQLVAAGADAALVARVAALLRRAEFKRRQAPPALKVSGRAFGSGWRFPIAAGG
jgi:NAD+ synthetase